jgi:hypothetical protein
MQSIDDKIGVVFPVPFQRMRPPTPGDKNFPDFWWAHASAMSLERPGLEHLRLELAEGQTVFVLGAGASVHTDALVMAAFLENA